MSRPDLSVVIVSWNSRDHLAACLDSVARACGGSEPEVWVVDNASADGSADLVAQAHPAAHVIRNAENAGFARAANQALRACTGRYALLLNPDTEVLGDGLAEMVRFLDAHPRVGMAGCRVENPDGTLQRGCRRMLPTPRRMLFRLAGLGALFPRHRLFAEYTMTHVPAAASHPVEAVSGSFLMIRRETFEQVGLLDEAFFMYGEDLDWCARAVAGGWEVFYHAGARVRHFLGQSSRQARRRTIRELHRAGRIYYRKHQAWRHPAVVNALVLGGLRLRCWLLLLLTPPDRPAPRAGRAAGTLAGAGVAGRQLGGN